MLCVCVWCTTVDSNQGSLFIDWAWIADASASGQWWGAVWSEETEQVSIGCRAESPVRLARLGGLAAVLEFFGASTPCATRRWELVDEAGNP